MVFCSNCGAEIDETQKFCPICGTKNEAAFKEVHEKVSEGSGEQEMSTSNMEKEKESKKSILNIDIKEDDVERAKEKAKKGFGAALRMARRGIDKGREIAEKGIDTAKETIDERKKRQKPKSLEDVKY
jgi:predicted ATP-dependent serine protease